MPVDIKKKNERDYNYQKNYLKRITVWFNTKSEADMELMQFVENFQGSSKSDNIKRCIRETMKAYENKEGVK